jgi:lipopolysaccharide export system protein LptA
LLFKHSVIDINGAMIECEKGEYDGETERGWFAGKASIKDIQGLLSGDSIFVNRQNNEGQAWGNVTVSDSSAAMTVCGDYASRIKGTEIVKVNDSTSFVKLMNIEGEDTLKMNCRVLEREQDLLFAYGGVVFEQGSFSGDGDSLSWDRGSDEIWLLGEPVVWSEEDEMTSDTVKMVLKQNKPSVMKLIGRANVFSPANDSLDHKISGRNLDAAFKEGKLHQVDVSGNGTVLYYSVDENEKMSRNRATCAHIQMLFSGGSVTRITLLSNPEGRFEELNNEIEDDPKGKDDLQKKRERPDL